MQTPQQPSPWAALYPDTLQTDGYWCPMAHCSRTDDSFQHLPPLRSVRHFQKLNHPVASSEGFIHLGSFTGQRMAVCTYSSPNFPALAAFDYKDGSVIWTSPMEDLRGLPRRVPLGILIASMGVKGLPPRTYVFAANRAEFVAYTEDGCRLWKRPNNEVVSGISNIGLPISLSFDNSKELVAATTRGWIVKLSPLDGRTIDAYKLDTTITVEGRLYRGTFFTCKSPIVIGDVLYILAEFMPHESNPLPALFRPVHVVRISLSQTGTPGRAEKIQPLAQSGREKDGFADRVFVGLNRGRGSPPACVSPDGRVLIFATAHKLYKDRLYPTIAGVEDNRGTLARRWLSVLEAPSGDSVHSAPALHGPSGSLFITTLRNIFLYRDVRHLVGNVRSPQPLAIADMVSLASSPRIAAVGVGSPFGLTFDSELKEIVAYTNFRAISRAGQSYGVLGAFSVPAFGGGRPRPLWNRPLGVTQGGEVLPGPGTLGQPALFRYQSEEGMATGLIVNTVFTGTYIMK